MKSQGHSMLIFFHFHGNIKTSNWPGLLNILYCLFLNIYLSFPKVSGDMIPNKLFFRVTFFLTKSSEFLLSKNKSDCFIVIE